MIALDTNVLMRFVLDDDPAQVRRARALLNDAEQSYWVPVTVVLEIVWVLRAQGWTSQRIVEGLRRLLALANLRPQHPAAVHRALSWYAEGVDFADALHLALSAEASEFKTFDQQLAKRAAALALSPTVTQP